MWKTMETIPGYFDPLEMQWSGYMYFYDKEQNQKGIKYLYFELYPGLLLCPKQDQDLQSVNQCFYQNNLSKETAAISTSNIVTGFSQRFLRYIELKDLLLKKINKKNIKDMPYEYGFTLTDSAQNRLEFSLPSISSFKKWVKQIKKYSKLVGFFKKYICLASLVPLRNYPHDEIYKSVHLKKKKNSGDFTNKRAEGNNALAGKRGAAGTTLFEVRAAKIKDSVRQARVLNELDILQRVKGPCLQTVIEVFNEAKTFYIVSEYSEGRTLREEIADDQPFEEILILHIMLKILQGVACLHEKRILHGSIDSVNIAFQNSNNDFFQLFLYNFENAIDFRLLHNNPPKKLSFTPTLPYAAPEMLNYTGQLSVEDYLKSDIYSLGIVLYQLNYLHIPTQKQIDDTLGVKLYKELDMSFGMTDLLQRMLQKDPSKRISAKQALLHQVFLKNKNQQGRSAFLRSHMNHRPSKMLQTIVERTVDHSEMTQSNLKSEEEQKQITSNNHYYMNNEQNGMAQSFLNSNQNFSYILPKESSFSQSNTIINQRSNSNNISQSITSYDVPPSSFTQPNHPAEEDDDEEEEFITKESSFEETITNHTSDQYGQQVFGNNSQIAAAVQRRASSTQRNMKDTIQQPKTKESSLKSPLQYSEEMPEQDDDEHYCPASFLMKETNRRALPSFAFISQLPLS